MVEMGIMTMKGRSTLSKVSELEPHLRMQFSVISWQPYKPSSNHARCCVLHFAIMPEGTARIPLFSLQLTEGQNLTLQIQPVSKENSAFKTSGGGARNLTPIKLTCHWKCRTITSVVLLRSYIPLGVCILS